MPKGLREEKPKLRKISFLDFTLTSITDEDKTYVLDGEYFNATFYITLKTSSSKEWKFQNKCWRAEIQFGGQDYCRRTLILETGVNSTKVIIDDINRIMPSIIKYCGKNTNLKGY